MNLFNALTVIEFESNNIDYYDMQEKWHQSKFTRDEQYQIYANSRIYKTWQTIYKLSPNLRTLDRLLSKFVGGHVSIKLGNYDLTFFGYNAMQWAIQLGTQSTYWLFRPPHYSLLDRRGFSWGRFYQSPNSTPWHPQAKIYYGN